VGTGTLYRHFPLDASDLLRALIGASYVGPGHDWQPSARRLVDILLAGSRRVGYLQLANIWMILNVGGGPTPDKPTVTLSVPDPNYINNKPSDYPLDGDRASPIHLNVTRRGAAESG
jgi:hypothetical protein